MYRLPDGELTSDGEVWKVRIVQLLPDQAGQEPVPVFHMRYLSDEGTIIVQHRDQSSLACIPRRVREDTRKDHAGDCSQLLHTLQLNDCVAALTAAGYAVCAGYLYLPGNRQLVPDACMEADWDLGERAVE